MTLRALLAAFACLTFAAASGGNAPDDAVLRYEVTCAGLTIGEATNRISFTGDNYSIVSKAEPLGIAKLLGIGEIESTSEGWLDEDGRLHMREFRYTTRSRSRRARVTEDGASIELGEDGNFATYPNLFENVEDLLTVLHMHYAAGKFIPLKSLLITDGRKASHYYLEQTAQPEEIATGAGTFSTVRQDRDTPIPSKRRTVWYAAGLGYLPVKYVLSQNFSDLVFTLTSFSTGPAP